MVQKTKKFKFNVIDVIVILLLIGLLAGIALRYDLAGKVGMGAKSDKVDLTFIVSNIQEESQNYIVPDLKFYYSAQNYEYGVIKEILDIRAALSTIETDNGIFNSDLEDQIDITGTITCYGKNTKEGFMINGNTYVAAGQIITLHSANITVAVTVLSMNDYTVKK